MRGMSTLPKLNTNPYFSSSTQHICVAGGLFKNYPYCFSSLPQRPRIMMEKPAASNTKSKSSYTFFIFFLLSNAMAIVPIHAQPQTTIQASPIISSYNNRFHPLLEALDKLRKMKVTSEGIQLPTIVVIGDQSSGKSSVLESLARINLPRGQGICTRVPLILRLQNQPANMEAEMILHYKDKVEKIGEENVTEAIESATIELAGNAKGISNSPLVLQVKNHGIPDLTMVDLPGITRVPVRDQPENIYEQIREIIMEYITPEESIILNVISASVDFSTCESIRMSQTVDKSGQRTLAVVTKADVAPEGLVDKVTKDDVNIGLGYVCVRNRLGDESYEAARKEEALLFETNPFLSKIDKSIVGTPVLAEKLLQIQAIIISKCLPNIVKQINDKLYAHVSELESLPEKLSSVAEAMTAFMRIMGLTKESLMKILIRGEYEEYPDDMEMHCVARLAEMLNQYSKELHQRAGIYRTDNFMMEEIIALEEAKMVVLPNFLPRPAFLVVLRKKVNRISTTPIEFVDKAWEYIELVLTKVLMYHVDSYPQLQSCVRKAVVDLMTRMKKHSVDRMLEIIEMEKLTDYTCHPEYTNDWRKLMSFQENFMKITKQYGVEQRHTSSMNIEGFGNVQVEHLKNFQSLCQEAFDLKMRITAYLKVVLRRLVDSMALHMLYSVRNLVSKDMEEQIVKELMSPSGGGMERLLDESPAIAAKRASLNKSIKLLRESREVVGSIVNMTSMDSEYSRLFN